MSASAMIATAVTTNGNDDVDGNVDVDVDVWKHLVETRVNESLPHFAQELKDCIVFHLTFSFHELTRKKYMIAGKTTYPYNIELFDSRSGNRKEQIGMKLYINSTSPYAESECECDYLSLLCCPKTKLHQYLLQYNNQAFMYIKHTSIYDREFGV